MPGRILVVENATANRDLVVQKLNAAYYDVLIAESRTEALRSAREDEVDLVLLDAMLHDVDGIELCRLLKTEAGTAHIPVVLVTPQGLQRERLRALEAGADDFLVKPMDELALLARVRNLIRMKVMVDELQLRDATAREFGLTTPAADEGAQTVAVLAPDPQTGATWRRRIEGALPVSVAVFAPDATELLATGMADAYVIHHRAMPDGGAMRCVAELRTRMLARSSAVLFIAADGDVRMAARALDLGANDYLFDGFTAEELTIRLRSQLKRKRFADSLRASVRDGLRAAVTDPLTGLFNRRYMEQHIGGLIARSRAETAPIAAMYLDLDRFKAVNDAMGHAAGDEVLKQVARRLQNHLRSEDLLVRLGGEEFGIVLPTTTKTHAAQLAERLREVIELHPFDVGGVKALSITTSIGVAVLDSAKATVDGLLRAADEALYASKNGGRNRVSFWSAAA
ncbi:MAG: diguanylate cyclase [Pseudomonadota bacterium]